MIAGLRGFSGLGVAPAGYQIVGLCNQGASGSTNPNTMELVMAPDGTTACYAANDPANPFYVAPSGVAVTPTNVPASSVTAPTGASAPALPGMPTNPILAGATAAAQAQANTDLMLGSFDATQFVANDWMWLVGGAAVLLVASMTMGK